MRILPLILLALFPLVSFGQTEGSIEAVSYSDYYERMPGTFRLGLLGSYVVQPPVGTYENANDSDMTAGLASAIVGLGSGMLSLEAGVAYVKTADISKRIEADGSEKAFLVNSSYWGIPIWVKYNYIEKSLYSFFVKAGAMPITLIEQSTALEDLEATAQSTIGIAGIGGTSALGDSTAFLLDLSILSHVGSENAGIPQTTATLGIGISYDL